MVGERVVTYNGNPFVKDGAKDGANDDDTGGTGGKDGETEGDGNVGNSFFKYGANEVVNEGDGSVGNEGNPGNSFRNSFPFAHLVASSLEVDDLDYLHTCLLPDIPPPGVAASKVRVIG